ncbi:hypothetical protein ANCCAN_02319 [Ancylostoma caninum]|uniref:Agouti signaling protein n=1 Tax=Ancylostoma caninum TaxID=29170 RepID=A0A368H4W1_ANCCA|nr:hypothetical protein ANCCAN_02319 [Ancylostoma caninum]
MKWLAIVLCLALFCIGIIQSAPLKDSSKELKNVSSRVKLSPHSTVKREAKEDKKKDTVSPSISSVPQVSFSLEPFMCSS